VVLITKILMGVKIRTGYTQIYLDEIIYFVARDILYLDIS